jgi:hypothetical protein
MHGFALGVLVSVGEEASLSGAGVVVAPMPPSMLLEHRQDDDSDAPPRAAAGEASLASPQGAAAYDDDGHPHNVDYDAVEVVAAMALDEAEAVEASAEAAEAVCEYLDDAPGRWGQMSAPAVSSGAPPGGQRTVAVVTSSRWLDGEGGEGDRDAHDDGSGDAALSCDGPLEAANFLCLWRATQVDPEATTRESEMDECI